MPPKGQFLHWGVRGELPGQTPAYWGLALPGSATSHRGLMMAQAPHQHSLMKWQTPVSLQLSSIRSHIWVFDCPQSRRVTSRVVGQGPMSTVTPCIPKPCTEARIQSESPGRQSEQEAWGTVS